jgi:hypothetical protein
VSNTQELAQRWRDLVGDEALGYTERFERDAELFYRETGLMAPGKSMPLEMWNTQTEDERRAKWDAWCADRRRAFYADVRATADLLDRLASLHDAIRVLIHEEHIGDYVYQVRERALSDPSFSGSTWDHPRVKKFSDAVKRLADEVPK